ncbi:MAG: hypothetical protein EA422_03795 [Gemmatimonadales bacterium]|nr:MAG: hypothetical protein EA422_03795 [Gemmatimonadales bacterium]
MTSRFRWGSGRRRGRCFLLLALAALPLLTACNPLYLTRAGWAQAQILASREPLHQVLVDPATDPRERGKLVLAREARTFAVESLGFRNAGESYTTLARLPSDTLALVLTAAPRDRLELHTWWFPVVGRMPYRAYFSDRRAEEARLAMEARGFDAFVRPTAAFSTLGWFADPIYSTLLRQDEVGVVETIFHELAHNHLFLPGQGRFNESYATFAGNAAAIVFFCSRDGGGPDTVWCARARDRWDDARIVSRFMMELEADLRGIFSRVDLPRDERIRLRDQRYDEAFRTFRDEIRPGLAGGGYAVLASEPLNNATLLARSLYFQRLDDFHHLWAEVWDGNLAGLMAWLREEAPGRDDPFSVLDDPPPEPPGHPTGSRPEGVAAGDGSGFES